MHAVIAQLSNDHTILKEVLDSTGYLIEAGKLEEHRDSIPSIIDFFYKFMDQYHHGKEERFVFPLAENGPAEVRHIIPELTEDHHKAKQYVDNMKMALDGSDLRTFAGAAKELIYVHK